MLTQAGGVRLVGTLAEAARQHKTQPGGVALAGAGAVNLAGLLMQGVQHADK